MNALQKILVPTDFSLHAEEAFRVAHTLAQMSGATVVVFHVAHPPAVITEGGPLVGDPVKGEASDLWERFQHLQPTDSKVQVEHRVIVADRADALHIIEFVDRAGCDLIVIGTQGHSWLKHRLFGSLTEEVVRLAPCPVMVVKAPARTQNQPTPEPALAIEA